MSRAVGLKIRVLLTALFVSGSVLAQTQQPAGTTQDPELQLQAIRQAILGAMGGAPTRVLSTAWVDAKGALHETTLYNTDAKVKGVRVLGYLNEGRETSEQQAARLAVDVALPHYLKKTGQDKGCTTNGWAYRMPVGMETTVQPGSGELDAAVGAWLDKETKQFMSDLTAQSSRWYATPAQRVTAQQQGQSDYWTSLLGSTWESSEWTLKVQLHRMDDLDSGHSGAHSKTPEFLRSWIGQSSAEIWQMHLSLSQLGHEPVWHWTSMLENVPTDSSHAAAGMSKSLHEKFRQAVHDLDQKTECTPVKFTIKAPHASGAGRDLILAVGERSRLKPGDRLLVLDRQSIPSRMLEPGALDRVGLAEVVHIEGKRTQLRQLAGPPLPPQGDWVAMPL
jgi:hypothetical protein